MKEFDFMKQVKKSLNKVVLYENAEKRFDNKINTLFDQFHHLLSDSSKLYEKKQIDKYYEEECLKLSINAEESKETEIQLNPKINEQNISASRKFFQLMNIMNDSKNFSFDSTGEVDKKKIIQFEVALNAAGVNLCYDTPENVISGFVVNENSPLPVQAFEFNLKDITETELNYKMWELVKENSTNFTSDYEHSKD